jgi:large subunit ribosomal protein L24e
MVVKRQCSFCAGEIEPGTGLQFVKRDGTIFHFCSGSCRKQQLALGRVGHRVRWTRAHALKRELSATTAASLAAKSKATSERKTTSPAPSATPPPTPASEEKPPTAKSNAPKSSKSSAAKSKS